MKKFYKSRTVWFNALTILVVVATVFGYSPDTELVEQTSKLLIVVAPLVNLVLRFVTKTGVTL